MEVITMEKQQQELQEQFLQLLSITENTQQRMISLEKSSQILLRSQRQFAQWMDDTLSDIEHYKENVFFEIMDDRNGQNEGEFWYPKIVSQEETFHQLIEGKASMARFGDGEFAAMQGKIRHKFQTMQDSGLADRLHEVLHAKEDNLLIAIADNYGTLDRYSMQAKREIRYYMTRQVRKEHMALLERDRLYHDAYITRPYVMYADNQSNAPLYRFSRLKQIWKHRDCIFVEGNQTGLGVGNDLFAHAGSIKRILGPAENAYRAYSQILEACLNQSKEKLFLIALGPTATVLAYDLHRAGYQAIDIGHIDLEYEWFLRGTGQRTKVEGKYNNEVAGGEHPVKLKDTVYASQIITDISL